MSTWLGRARPRALLVALLATVLLATACGDVQVSEQAIEKQHILSTGVAGESISVLGVDFDPPLNYVNTLRAQGVTLLVALENRGTAPVRDVRVLARLHLDEGEEQVIERDGFIQELPPGQVVVYRFPRLHTLPLRRSYTLEVRVLSADGRRVLHRRTYTVHVQGEENRQPIRLRAPGK